MREASRARGIKIHKSPARGAENLVDLISRHKAGILASSIGLAILLGVTALIAVGNHDGDQLTEVVADVGGFVAIAGFVLGLPALTYAMVTDHNIDTLKKSLSDLLVDALSVTEGELGNIRDRIRNLTRGVLPAQHQVQVFVPNRKQTLLLPIYDPDEEGPEEGWEIDPVAPQAITGSAWVADEYMWALHDRLSDPALRLTPDQQKRYERLTGVAAAPIRNGQGERIGVLTVFSTAESPDMANPGFIKRHLALANELSSIVSQYVAAEGPLEFEPVSPEQAPDHDSGSIKP